MRQYAATLLLAVTACVGPVFACSAGGRDEMSERREMVRVITAHDSYVRADRAPISQSVLNAMLEVPRHRFVPEELRHRAYQDRPLPIGNGQTISQPYIVALMTDLLEPRPNDIVLEVGTGSAYQAAVLSRLVRRVHTIEIVRPLADDAAKRLKSLGYDNVTVRTGDGYLGWPEAAPFDGIMVTAGADHVPEPLVAQLKPGGRLVMPIGSTSGQQLILLKKDLQGHVDQERILAVAFVPMTGRVRDNF